MRWNNCWAKRRHWPNSLANKSGSMYLRIFFNSVKKLINEHDKKVFLCIALIYSINIVRFAGSTDFTTHKEYSPFYVSDFSAFLTSAYIIKDDNAGNLYNLNTQRKYLNEVIKPYKRGEVVLTYRNPPLLAFLFLPYTLIEPILAFKVYVFVSSMVVFLGIFILTRKLKLKSTYFAIIASIFYSTISTLITGQLGSYLLLILCLIYVNILENRYTQAGLLSTLLLFKPQYALLIPLIWIALRFNKSYLKAVILGGIVFIIANFLIFGSNPFPEYISFLYYSETYNMGTDIEKNYSLLSLLSVFTSNPLSITLIVSALLYILFLLLYITKKNNRKILLFTGILIILPLAVHVNLADLIMSLVPLIFFVSEYNRSGNTKYLYSVIIIYLIPYIYLANIVWLGGLLYFLVIALILKPSNSISLPNTTPHPNS